ncbi:hypothetical protein MA16_Dca022251 [Dendrobium catenatum]|uniref:Uncharacterized protein n=1 Tax=Dendrobium catenatum TaxID=906689 RepID=A0A2I0WH68_9ASPA|nr:hypothetical protein MA16_Dca022251 [Dendrobium catenatum]
MMDLSPLAEGSRFYPLSLSWGEEDVKKIDAPTPRPPSRTFESTLDEMKKKWEKGIRRIFQRVANQMHTTKEDVIKAKKNTITNDFTKLLLKEDIDLEDSRLIVQPTQRDRR